MEATYPSLYRFRTKDEVAKMFDSCYSSLKTDSSLLSFFATVKYALSYLGDGHLSASPGPGLRNAIEKQYTSFPLPLKFLQGQAYVVCPGGADIPEGAQILAINNQPVSHIAYTAFKYISNDGSITSRKWRVLDRFFWLYYAMAFGFTDSFEVKWLNKDGVSQLSRLKGSTGRPPTCEPLETPDEKTFQYKRVKDKYAIIKISSFNSETQDGYATFQSFLDSCFASLRQHNIGQLIVDLRGNGGGNDLFGALLYSHLTDRPFYYYASLQKVSGKLTARDHPNLKIQQPARKPFNGRVFFLIDGITFSAAAEFCAIARSNKRGAFIGEETGGGYEGNTSGGSTAHTLANSGITINIPTTRYDMAVEAVRQTGRGIIPDYPVTPSIREFLQKKDVQMNSAIRLAEHQNP